MKKAPMKKSKKSRVSVAAETQKLSLSVNVVLEEQLLLPLSQKPVISATVVGENPVLEESPEKSFTDPKPGFFRIIFGNHQRHAALSEKRKLKLEQIMRSAFVAPTVSASASASA